MSRGISTISNPCQVRDSLTGEGIAGATVHVRNITRVDRYGHMDNDIGHDIKSGEENIGKKAQIMTFNGRLILILIPDIKDP